MPLDRSQFPQFTDEEFARLQQQVDAGAGASGAAPAPEAPPPEPPAVQLPPGYDPYVEQQKANAEAERDYLRTKDAPPVLEKMQGAPEALRAAAENLRAVLADKNAPLEKIQQAQADFAKQIGEERNLSGELGRTVPQMRADFQSGKLRMAPTAPTGALASNAVSSAVSGAIGSAVRGVLPEQAQARSAAPGAGGSTAGYGYDLSKILNPVELRAGVQIGDIQSPGEYASELRSAIARGDISPEEGRKRSQEYRDWYNSVAGGATRLEGSQIAQQRQLAEAALEQQRADIASEQQINDLKAQAAKHAADLDEAQQAAAQAYEQSVRDSQKNLASAMEKAEQFKIDPARTFSSGSGIAAGVFSALGLALGGIGQALTRGQQPNPLPPMIDKMIDREVDAQKTKAAQLAKGVADRQSLMAMARSHFVDEDQQRAVAKAAMYSSLVAQAEQIRDNATNDNARKAADIAADQLRQKVADQQLAFELRTKANAEAQARAMQQAAYASQAAKAEQAQKEKLGQLLGGGGATAAIDVAGDPVWGKLAMNYDKTTKQYLLNEQDAKKSQGVRELQDIADSVDEIRDLVAREGSSLDSHAKAKIQALAARIKPRLAVATGQGAMSEGDAENIAKGLPEGGVDIWNTQMDRLDTTAASLRRQADVTAKSLSGIPGEAPAMLPDENGIPRLYAQPYMQGGAAPRAFVEVGEGKSKRKVRVGETVKTPETQLPEVHATPGASKERLYKRVGNTGVEEQQ